MLENQPVTEENVINTQYSNRVQHSSGAGIRVSLRQQLNPRINLASSELRVNQSLCESLNRLEKTYGISVQRGQPVFLSHLIIVPSTIDSPI